MNHIKPCNNRVEYEVPRVEDFIFISIGPFLEGSNLEPIEGGDSPFINW